VQWLGFVALSSLLQRRQGPGSIPGVGIIVFAAQGDIQGVVGVVVWPCGASVNFCEARNNAKRQDLGARDIAIVAETIDFILCSQTVVVVHGIGWGMGKL
jgi:hypothetical protein